MDLDERLLETADEHEQTCIDQEVERTRKRKGPAPVYDQEGRPHCVECDDTIPRQRAELGYGRCVPCQEKHESLERRGIR